jgi:CubicO group peptidase (beta-lactamase class C family)
MKRIAISLVFGALATGAAAQAPVDQALPPLTDFVGTYAGEPGAPSAPIEVVVGDDGLFAVLDEAKYGLKRTGADTFINAVGGKVVFQRDAAGKVATVLEGETPHARLSAAVLPASAALVRPRPVGEATYHYRPPVDRHDGIAVGDIAASDLDVATAETIVRGVIDGTWKDVHGVLIFQRGHLVLEEYFYGYGPDRPHQLRSATKSIVSAAAGLAVDRGLLKGADQPVVPRLTYSDYANPDPRKAKITLGDFLTMSPGLACDDYDNASPGRETVIDEAPDWVKATLDLPMINDPGSKGFYCSGGVAVVGRTTENAVGMSLPDFADKTLFGPLGVRRSDWRWNYTLTNANKEYSQIHLRPRDMLKVGLLYADHGQWKGKQVMSRAWADASLAAHSKVDGTDYGYFWWRPWQRVETAQGPRKVSFAAAQGNGGQKIYILPEYELVAVFTGGAYNAPTAPNRIMAKVILPRLIAARPQTPLPPPME